MDDQQLDLTLAAMGRERMAVADPPALHERAMEVPLAIRRRRVSLPMPTGRFQFMFSAGKFLVAGALVALAGGFLLAGVLTQPNDAALPGVVASASATATEVVTGEPDIATTATPADILPGVDLEVEELHPGVFRVVSDGQRELRWAPGEAYWVTPSAITVAPDGGVWSFTLPEYDGEGCRVEPGEVGCMVFYRLGSSETHEMLDEWFLDDGAIGAGRDPVAVAEDGTIWAIVRRSYESADPGVPELRSFDGGAWTVRRKAQDMALARDGSVPCLSG